MAIECSETIVSERDGLDLFEIIPIVAMGALIGAVAVDTLTSRNII